MAPQEVDVELDQNVQHMDTAGSRCTKVIPCLEGNICDYVSSLCRSCVTACNPHLGDTVLPDCATACPHVNRTITAAEIAPLPPFVKQEACTYGYTLYHVTISLLAVYSLCVTLVLVATLYCWYRSSSKHPADSEEKSELISNDSFNDRAIPELGRQGNANIYSVPSDMDRESYKPPVNTIRCAIAATGPDAVSLISETDRQYDNKTYAIRSGVTPSENEKRDDTDVTAAGNSCALAEPLCSPKWNDKSNESKNYAPYGLSLRENQQVNESGQQTNITRSSSPNKLSFCKLNTDSAMPICDHGADTETDSLKVAMDNAMPHKDVRDDRGQHGALPRLPETSRQHLHSQSSSLAVHGGEQKSGSLNKNADPAGRNEAPAVPASQSPTVMNVVDMRGPTTASDAPSDETDLKQPNNHHHAEQSGPFPHYTKSTCPSNSDHERSERDYMQIQPTSDTMYTHPYASPQYSLQPPLSSNSTDTQKLHQAANHEHLSRDQTDGIATGLLPVMNHQPSSYEARGRLEADGRMSPCSAHHPVIDAHPDCDDGHRSAVSIRYGSTSGRRDSRSSQQGGVLAEDLELIRQMEEHPDWQTFEAMKEFSWVQGFTSEGADIDVYVDSTRIDRYNALAELVAATKESPTKFNINMCD